MENDNKSFEQILASISDKDVMTLYQPLSRAQIEENNNLEISAEIQKFYLAYYASMAVEHVGFDGFSKENQEGFKQKIEELYNNIDKNRLQGEFLREMASLTARYIEDRHFEVGVGEQTFRGGDKKEASSVGSNFFFSKNKPDGYEVVGQGWFGDGNERFPTWEIGTLKQNGEDVLVVSIPNLSYKNDYESWQDFIETFDKVYLQDREKWEKGRIVLDVRGNRGGEDKPIDHVAKRLYGNHLNTYKRCEIKDTALSDFILHQHGAYKPQNYERSGLTEKDLVRRCNFSGENKTLFDETGTYYPFNEKSGYRGRIDILIDRDVGSSAESAFTSFYHHPNTRFIGENTAGMQQYTQGTFATPWGGSMRVGATKLTYWDKEGENIEVKGHKPDVNCSGYDAFNVAMALGVDDGRVVGFREKNEKTSDNLVGAEYNPKEPTDPRKAYYAKYLDPAIREIEKKNKIEDSKRRIRGKMKSSTDIVEPNYEDVRIVEPSAEHYEAFKKACAEMRAYLDNDKPDDVSKEISRGFIFVRDGYANMSKEDFERDIVDGYKEKSKKGAEKPEYFRFIMVGDTIVGSVNVRGLKRDTIDDDNGLSTYKEWEGKRVTTSCVVLENYRGNDIAGKAKALFFDEIRKLGIEEVTGTVRSDNKPSIRAQEKMMAKYGGRKYNVRDEDHGIDYIRYVISTDTSGKSKDLYKSASHTKNQHITNSRDNEM